MKTTLNKELLIEETHLLQRAIETLNLSIDKCQAIGIKELYSFEEMESFDSLTSKFNRTADIFTQKVLRTVWALLHEPYVPFIDFMNNAEKVELINSADILIEIRDLRNQIAHEYIPEAIQNLVPEVITYSHHLIENINSTFQFINKREWINTI